MVTKEIVEIYVNLLVDWQNLLLRGNARSFFFIWLSDHTQMEFLSADKARLSEWLLTLKDPKQVCSEILIIHAEILWLSKLPCTQKVEGTFIL
jgi:hypothetical protein